MSLLRCVALAAMMGCAARAGGGVFIPPDNEDSGTTMNPDVVNPATTDTGGSGACTPPEFGCNGRCANLLTDNANCGMCGRACPGGSTCSAGACVTAPACPAPRMSCGGACVDVTNSTAHCGACGNACASGQSCVAGACMGGGGCPSGQTSCSGTCVDTRTSAQNCGLCGIACASGQTCSNGACVGGQACIAPRMMCGADCVDVLSSTQHCGFCNRACAAGQTCNSGTCSGGGGGCTSPNISCGGVCVNPLNNAQNCGSCLNACASGQSCSNGVCTGGGGGGVAGRSCTGATDTSCGTTLECANVGGQFTCTGACLQNTSQTNERGQCGGGTSTCLTLDAATGDGFCTASCVANGGTCRAGTACTTRSLQLTTPDAAGCFPFCRTNSHCMPGSVCNVRTGFCGPAAANLTRLADGSPCNPTLTETPPGETTPRNTQCRGVCFRTSATVMTQGICGSLINLTETTTCPDPGVGARGSMTDEIGICIYRDCTRNADCGTTLRCVYPERSGVPDRTLDPICNYATTAQPSGIP